MNKVLKIQNFFLKPVIFFILLFNKHKLFGTMGIFGMSLSHDYRDLMIEHSQTKKNG